MKRTIPLWIIFLCILFILPLDIFAQCFKAPYGRSPSTTQTIANYNGTYQTIASNCHNGQYSKINVAKGNIYSFKSSRSTDYITISDNNGTVAYAKGTGTVTWMATLTTVVRFYTHKNAACGTDTKSEKRLAACTLPGCSSPDSLIASAITNTTATISWAAASAAPNNGYTYEIRTSGAGGSGSSGLVSNGSTSAGVTSANITALTAGTLYIPYVRSHCGTSYRSHVAGSSFTTTDNASNPVPAFTHIVVVIGENTSAGSVFGSSSAPYINALAAAGAKFTNSFALFHPSQPNYLGFYSGSKQGITDDSYITTKFTTANLGRELINAGKTYATYSEDLPSVGYDGASSGLYVRKHNPAASWMGKGSNQIPTATNQPFTAFPLTFSELPNVSFVIPNLCNDGHNVCAPLNNSVKQFDTWLKTHMDAYKQWCINNNSLLIVTYDEDDRNSANKIATVFYGANVTNGIYSETVNHYNILRTIEDASRLTTHAGAAASVIPVDYCWTVSRCSSPDSVITALITDTTATISWPAPATAPNNGYTYEIRTSGMGGSDSTGLVSSGSISAGVTSANVIGLSARTLYFPYVRSHCDTSYSSYFAGSSFTTDTTSNPVDTTSNPIDTTLKPFPTASNQVPHFDHIVVVIGENTRAGSVFGSSSAPYINALADAGAKFTNSFALFHPSQPNYLGFYSGSKQGITGDSYITTKFTTANLGRELINAGKTYTTYSEDLPSVGYDGSNSGLYVRKHNPAASWMGKGSNQIPATTNQPFTAFPSTFSTLPTVSLVIPNLCSDGHNVCAPLNNSVKQFDTWLKTHMDAYKKWCINNNSLLIVTYDEDDRNGANKIATVFYGANVAKGIYSETVNHYNILRTIEEATRLTTHAGAAASATPVGYCWTVTVNLVNNLISSTQKEVTSASNIYIYPNPANDKINILPGDMVAKRDIRWEISAVTGVTLKTGKVTNVSKDSRIEIATGNLKNGIYLVRISDSVNVWVSRFIIVR